MRALVAGIVAAVVVTGLSLGADPSRSNEPRSRLLFSDDFENGLVQWDVIGEGTARLMPSGDSAHGMVLALVPNGDAAALIRGSERWRRVRFEGEMSFRTDDESYLGLVYAFTARGSRRDFGLIYVKGDDNYLQVNPHRDFNVSRLLYPEGRVTLDGKSLIRIGAWQRFALEIDGAAAHLYIGDTEVPQITFDGFEGAHGRIGLQPRSVGGEVWVDNVTVRAIDRLAYSGPAIPPVPRADPTSITSWQVAGPFDRTRDRLAFAPGADPGAWRPFATDARGAVVSGRIVDYHGPGAVAYFRTNLASSTDRAELQLGTIDDVAIWVNGTFQGFVARQDAAWFDAGRNEAHPARRVPLTLRAGTNEVVIRVRGGVYASGGFFARLLRGVRR